MTKMLVFDPPYLVRRGFRDGLKIDYMGFGLLALGLGSLEVVLDEGQKEDWFGSQFIVGFAIVAAICLVAVVFWELRHEHPVIDFRVLKIRNFMLGTLSMLVLGFVLYGSTMLLPVLLQTLLGYTAMLSGLVLSPGGLVVIVCMPMVGVLLRHFQARWLVIFGVLVSASGLVIMSRFNLYIDYETAVWSRMVQSAGMAFLFVPISVATVAMVPRDRMNYATGLFNLARNIGGSSGIATVTTLLARRAQMHQQVLTAHLTPFDAAYRNALGRTTELLHAHGATMPDAARQAGGLLYGGLLRQAAMLAFADAFWVMALLFVLIIPLMLLMKRTGPMHGPAVME